MAFSSAQSLAQVFTALMPISPCTQMTTLKRCSVIRRSWLDSRGKKQEKAGHYELNIGNGSNLRKAISGACSKNVNPSLQMRCVFATLGINKPYGVYKSIDRRAGRSLGPRLTG